MGLAKISLLLRKLRAPVLCNKETIKSNAQEEDNGRKLHDIAVHEAEIPPDEPKAAASTQTFLTP